MRVQIVRAEVVVGLDMDSRDAKRLMYRLNRLRGIAATYVGAYHADPSYCQIYVAGMTEESLDNWLYHVNHGCEYVGTFNPSPLSEYQCAA